MDEKREMSKDAKGIVVAIATVGVALLVGLGGLTTYLHGDLGGQIAEVRGSIDGLRSDLGGQIAEMRGEVAGLQERMARVEVRLDGVEHRLDGVEQRLDGIEDALPPRPAPAELAAAVLPEGAP